jgi:hypothetical protein
LDDHRLRIVLLLALLLFQISLGYVLPAQAQGQRLVLAFYYAWYDENTWTYDQVPDLPLSPYRSADRATIERHVQEARSAGIDAFVQSWYGPGENQTEANFVTLLDVAQEQGLRATVDFETVSPFMPSLESLVNGLAHLIDVHARHPAFLRYDGRPVIFFWREQRLSVETWASIRAQVDPDRDTIWIADGDDPAWLDVFDGLHLYTITWRENTNPMYTATKMRKRVDQYIAGHAGPRFWVATAMPGYDDTHIAGQPHPYTYPRSPAYYRETWEAAMSSDPEMIVITSFNEWREGTMIEPSITYGNTYLDLTRELAAQYKEGVVPTPTALSSPTPTALSSPTPTALSSPTPTATASLAPTPTEMPAATPTPLAPTPTPTATASLTPTPMTTPTWTATATASLTPTPMTTPTWTATATASLTPTPMTTPTWTATATPSLAATATATATATETPVPTVTATALLAATATASLTATPSPTATPSSEATGGGEPASAGPPCLGAGMVMAGFAGIVLFKTASPRRFKAQVGRSGIERVERRVVTCFPD